MNCVHMNRDDNSMLERLWNTFRMVYYKASRLFTASSYLSSHRLWFPLFAFALLLIGSGALSFFKDPSDSLSLSAVDFNDALS